MSRRLGERMSVPVRAIDVFRLLAVGKIASDETFVRELNDGFDRFIHSVPQTPRLTNTKPKDYLNYSKPHGKADTKTLYNMSEEELCSFANGFMAVDDKETIGKVLDYQVPLEATSGSGEGVVDLISENGDTIFVIEAKRWKSNEHPLRALFEALTFWLELLDEGALKRKQDKSGNAKRFVSRYNASDPTKRQFSLGKGEKGFESNARLVPAILLSPGSRIFKNLCKKPKSPYFELYTKILKYVRCFSYRAEGGKTLKIAEFYPQKEWAKKKSSHTKR